MQELFGAATQIRTGDLILTKDALYLLSYSSIFDSFDIIARKFPCVNYFFSKRATFFVMQGKGRAAKALTAARPVSYYYYLISGSLDRLLAMSSSVGI